ncbi:Z1 domain-containing protein [Hymenobacter mucosus]|nr:Z1 domain-containing protein [Hymenobacter mucosus]
MARDNGYQVIIVLAGTQRALIRQSVERLTKDLQIVGANSLDWRIMSDPKGSHGEELIKATLNEYKSSSKSKLRKRTAIVAVMKNKTRLGNLIEVIEKLSEEFKGVPTLIVDDEADQAGMNTEAKANRKRLAAGLPEKLSPVYAQLLRLKSALPHHTYVQYTATPQALLFIRRKDDMSPNFIKLLTPGAGYTGGQAFFSKPLFKKLVKEIPDIEIHSPNHHLVTAPNSLQEAMRVFFLGVTEHLITDSAERNRSMMVHPSQYQDIHGQYFKWVTTVKGRWVRILKKDEDEPERQELVGQFKATYNELFSINSDMAPFEEHLDTLVDAISATQVNEFNGKPGSVSQIDWANHEFFILVGGQAMSRGFTVEGLTVTYMPRGIGVGTADTMQQWARFFGYKKKYIHLCRIYLAKDAIKAFQGYVKHESDLHARLKAFDADHTLNAFQRRVKLPSSLKHLTRNSVLSEDVERYSFGGAWITTETVQGSPAEIDANRAAIDSFISNPSFSWQPDRGSSERTPAQIHLTSEVMLTDIIKLLRSYTYLGTQDTSSLGYVYLSTDDADAFDMLADNLEAYSKAHPGATGVVYQMSPPPQKPRLRTASNGKLKQGPLFQGRNPSKEEGKAIYPGDTEIKDKGRFSLQIHRLEIKAGKVPGYESFVLAVWVPSDAADEMVKLANE